MKRILACLAVAALAAPAFAQQASTLQELTTKGMVMEAGGMEIDVTYKPDGTFTAMDGQVTGKWRIEGEKLCTSSNFSVPRCASSSRPSAKSIPTTTDRLGIICRTT